MARRIVASIALVSIAAATVYWLVRGGDQNDLRNASSAPSSSTGALTDAVPTAPATLSSVAAERPADAPARTSDPWWSALALEALRPQPAYPDGVPVRVVDNRTALPAADALVFVIFQDSAEDAVYDMGAATIVDLVRSGASCYTTDGQGETRVKLSGTTVHLAGVKGDCWATVRVDESTPKPVELRIRASSALVVETVGEHGAARTGVPIRFGRKTTQTDRRLWFDTRMRAVTSEGGRATFTGIDRYPGSSSTEWGLSLDCATKERTFVAVDRSSPPTEPVRMVVPPIGSIRVRVVDADGALVPLSGRVLLTSSEAGSDPNGLLTLVLHNGVSESATVGTGLRLNAFVEVQAFAQLRAQGAGPVADGDAATIDVPLPDPVQFDVVATLVSEKGEVCAGPSGSTFLAPTDQTGRWDNGNRELVADPDGIVRMPLGRVLMRHGAVRLAFRGTMPDGETGFGSWIDVPPPGGSKREIDLGDVVLREAELVVAGTVVDSSDRPIGGAMVMCDSSSRRGSLEDPWSTAMFQARTGSDGRFRFVRVADENAHEARLTAMARVEGWSVTGTARAPRGATDVRLRVEARGAVAGSVVLPVGIDCKQVAVALGDRPKPGEPDRWFDASSPKPSGNFITNEIEPGSYRFAVLRRNSRSWSAPLVAIDDVRVEPGNVTRDPRLARIDLGGRLHAVSIEVTDGDGAPVTKGTAYVVDRERGAGILDSIALGGKPVCLILDGRIDLLVLAPGFQRAWLRDVTGDGSLRLEKGLNRTVELNLTGFETLESGEALMARLEPIDLPLVEGDWPSAVADASGKASFTLDDPGRYRVYVKRGVRGLVDAAGRLLPTEPQIVTLDASSAPLAIEVRVVR